MENTELEHDELYGCKKAGRGWKAVIPGVSPALLFVRLVTSEPFLDNVL